MPIVTGKEGEDLRIAWKEANLAPLWESPIAHKPVSTAATSYCWPWSFIRPLIEQALYAVSPEEVERRVLVLASPEPDLQTAAGRATTRTMTAAMQVLLPGESARPHRHSMSALRFVLEGSGAVTKVDGKKCLMEHGDLILTPGWCWHEHDHAGSKPIIWLDVLDAPLHRYFGTAVFEPGPITKLPDVVADSAFATPNIVPETTVNRVSHSPVFRYPYSDAVAAVASAPAGPDGARRVRYVNPLTGEAALSMIDSHLMQLDLGVKTTPFRTTSNAICTVVEGEGESKVGEQTISWEANDVFTLPPGNWITHQSKKGAARLFIVSDREAFSKLGLLKEEYGGR